MRLLQAVGIAGVLAILAAGCGGQAPDFVGGGRIGSGLGAPCVIVLTINNNQMTDPGPVTCHLNGPVVFIVVNNDPGDHTVTIDPGTITDKRTNAKKNPFIETAAGNGNPHRADFDVIRFHVKNDPSYAGSYKYIVTWSGPAGSGTLDPELDIAN